jgi:hypothetical protein
MTSTQEQGTSQSAQENPDAGKWDVSADDGVSELIPYDPSSDDGEIVQGEVVESSTEQDSSDNKSEELKQLEDEFGMSFGQEVTVMRNPSEENPESRLENGWYVGNLTTDEEGNKFVEVMKADPENPGGRLVKDYPLKELKDLQPDSEEDSAGSTAETTEQTERNPELPPQATLLERAANRLNKMIVNRAHKKALKENGQREAAQQQERVDSQEDAFATYEDNVAASKELDRQYEERGTQQLEAQAMNEKFDSDAARAEKIEEAREKIRQTARSIMSALLEAGALTVVGTKKAIESGGQGAKRTAEVAKSSAETAALAALIAKDKTSSAAETAALKGMFAYDKAKETAVDAKNYAKAGIDFTKQQAGEAYTATREKAISLKDAAKNRIQARWNKIKNGSKEKYQSGKNSLRARRTAGRLALGAYRDHMDATKSGQ